MIDRQGRKIVFECDTCDETATSEDGEDFAEVWTRLKKEGWKARTVGAEWLHGCPRCGV